LKNSVTSGDAQMLADLINSSLQQVSNELTLLPAVYSVEANDVLCEYVIQQHEVFTKLSTTNSTTHALIDITRMWHKALDDDDSIRALFVDCSKAFDHVNHPTILRKMAAMNIHLCLLKWLHKFLLECQ